MIFSVFDFLSPTNSIYFHGKERHLSIVSGLLSIIAVIGMLVFSILFFIELLNKNNPTAYFYNRYSSEIGSFPFNSSSMFHFVTIGNKPIDFRAVTVFSTYKYITDYVENSDISQFEHWIYGVCDKSDLDSIQIDNNTYLEEGGCIKEYWNVEKRQYFKKGEQGFNWPSISDAASLNKPYGIFVERCKNNTGEILHKTDCYQESEIEEYIIKSQFIILNFIDHYVDVADYKNPSIKYFYKFTSGMFIDTSFTVNHLNYNPITIRTNKGLVFDQIVEDNSFMFYQNEKTSMITDDYRILGSFYFWMQNNVQLYERSYKKLQEILGSIGGMFQIIIGVAKILNTLFNDYQIHKDSNYLNNTYLPKENNKIPTRLESNSKILLNSQNKNLSVLTYKTVCSRKHLQKEKDQSIINIEPTPQPEKIKNLPFLKYLCLNYFCCDIDNKRKNILLQSTTLRKKIISEEFLFRCYYIYTVAGKNDVEKKRVTFSPEEGNKLQSLSVKPLNIS